MSKVARVILDSPLPSLDKIFDYAVAKEIEPVLAVGQHVRVPFGRSKILQDAFVVEIAEGSDFLGKLSTVSQIVSPQAVLPTNIYHLARDVADRQASTVADVLSSAIVKRSVRVEKAFLERAEPKQATMQPKSVCLSASLVRPTQVEN
jgi:primosomal protein N' (replication factor Y)